MNTAAASRFFALLTIAADLAAVGVVIWALIARYSPRARRHWRSFRRLLATNGVALAWLVALVSTLGSLYYSEVAHFLPCKFCWYQRIAMYPLVIVLGVAAVFKDAKVRRYVVPLVAIGGSISAFHYILQRFPDLGGASCDPAAPCTVTWVWEFHFISIPFMALSAFSLIATLLLVIPRGSEPAQDEQTGRETHDVDNGRPAHLDVPGGDRGDSSPIRSGARDDALVGDDRDRAIGRRDRRRGRDRGRAAAP